MSICEKEVKKILDKDLKTKYYISYYKNLCDYAHKGSKYALQEFDLRYNYINALNHRYMIIHVHSDNKNQFMQVIKAYCYYHTKDYLNCRILLDRLIEKNNKYAVTGLAWWYICYRKYAKAAEYAFKGAELGDSGAYRCLAHLEVGGVLEQSVQHTAQRDTYIGYAEKGAAMNNPAGYDSIAMHYIDRESLSECYKYAKKGSELGSMGCDIMLAYIYANISKSDPIYNPDKAKVIMYKWFDKNIILNPVYSRGLEQFQMQQAVKYAVEKEDLSWLRRVYPDKDVQKSIVSILADKF
jgi:hypothetical protein